MQLIKNLQLITRMSKKTLSKPTKKFQLPLVLFCFFVVIFAFSIFNLSFYLLQRNYYGLWVNSGKVLSQTTKYNEERQIEYWEEFLKENPTYQDGYLELGKLYYNNGNFSKSEELMEIAKSLNPNSEKLKSLLKEIN